MGYKREITITVMAITFTVTATMLTNADYWRIAQDGFGSLRHALEFGAFVAITLALLYGNFVYQVSRLGCLRREARHTTATQDELETLYAGSVPGMAILIPSYREEQRVLRQTLFSAALVEYPDRRVVVLIDDPLTGNHDDFVKLAATRRTVEDTDALFAEAAGRLDAELRAFLHRQAARMLEPAGESLRLAALYDDVAAWLEQRALELTLASGGALSHSDDFFIERVLLVPARGHSHRAERLRTGLLDERMIEREYRRIAALLRVEITSFERKRYANLSHACNKAMNLNAYIGLMGGSFRESAVGDGLHLTPCSPAEATLIVPSAKYLLTLDADSLVVSDYALRLIPLMERDRRVAVAQTPYSAITGAPAAIERVAGATTDVQYVVHQGFTQHRATYWVGANALLRFHALAEIRQTVVERGHPVPVFIQDRTVIEDTGSTIDLVRRGWTLYNYPERLAFSATPPDFGSLVVQRRRWSNGGLIILPDLLRFCLERGPHRPRFTEAAIRIYYLVSPAIANLGLLALLLYPFDSHLVSFWLPFTAAPYYVMYGRDLRRSGYRWRDLLGVYALNLLLVPVNLAGVVASFQQLVTGRKTAFGRTPKVENRTATPRRYIALNLGLIAFLFVATVVDVVHRQYSHALFAAANEVLYVYGFHRFIGLREAAVDLTAGTTGRWSELFERIATSARTQARPAVRPRAAYSPPVIDTYRSAAMEWETRLSGQEQVRSEDMLFESAGEAVLL